MVRALVEGQLEEIVLPEVFRQIGGGNALPIVRNAMGGANFWRDVRRYNEAARYQWVVALADLEGNPCASGLIARHLPSGREPMFHLRLAVRMVESWLLADRRSIARFLGISVSLVPVAPEGEEDPKRKLVQLAARSRRRVIREGLVPIDTGASVGTQYLPLLRQYVEKEWDVAAARQVSSSLNRACHRWLAMKEQL